GVDEDELASGELNDRWFSEPERVAEERREREATTLHGKGPPSWRLALTKHAWVAAAAALWLGSLLAVAAAR
ncbi:MAG TPA: hypothetical protein VHS09_11965, partial [Polyangiaceae bacterium]|nr:hypothetical protein [Polyangiaceae bacterium]